MPSWPKKGRNRVRKDVLTRWCARVSIPEWHSPFNIFGDVTVSPPIGEAQDEWKHGSVIVQELRRSGWRIETNTLVTFEVG